MNQGTTMLEVHSELNVNNIEGVADTMSQWHPAILGQMLLAVDVAYKRRCNRPHNDYLSAVRHISKPGGGGKTNE